MSPEFQYPTRDVHIWTPPTISTCLIAAAVIAFAGLLASWFPALNASLSNPSEVMRAD